MLTSNVPEITIRKANQKDSWIIKKLVREARIYPFRLNWRRFIVAVEPGGNVIGCCQIKPRRDGCLELASLVVHLEFRGHGIARKIIETLLKTIDDDLYLICKESLGVFYQKFGFKPITFSEMPRFYSRVSRIASLSDSFRSGERLLVMQWKSTVDQERISRV